MSAWKYWLCRVILLLDLIPRYGRLYDVVPDAKDTGHRNLGPSRWTWQRRGHWGLNILERFRLLWPYLKEYERRHPDASSGTVVGRDDD